MGDSHATNETKYQNEGVTNSAPEEALCPCQK